MGKVYCVGGCVRDRLLGIKSDDIDFTFVLDDLTETPEQGFSRMVDHLEKENFKIWLKTPDMFTIRAQFPMDHKNAGLTADFVMARKEVGYIEGTRSPKLVLGTIEDDLIRRDFTLNAMAEDENGNLIDLFDGRKHLNMKILVTPRDPNITFMDDPLRMVRALRFSVTKGFDIHTDVWNAMFQEGLIEKFMNVVSIERTRNELKKMFEHDTLSAMRLLAKVDERSPGFMNAVFSKGMWLLPTFKKTGK